MDKATESKYPELTLTVWSSWLEFHVEKEHIWAQQGRVLGFISNSDEVMGRAGGERKKAAMCPE